MKVSCVITSKKKHSAPGKILGPCTECGQGCTEKDRVGATDPILWCGECVFGHLLIAAAAKADR